MARDPNAAYYPPPGAVSDLDGWEQEVTGRSLTAASLALAAVATLLPVIPAVIGIVLAHRASRKGDPLGRTALILNCISLGVGVVVVVLVSNLDVQASLMAPTGWP